MILYNYETDFKLQQEEKITEWIISTAKQEKKNIGEISYIFCDDDYIIKMNKEYLQHDYYTDIITFDYSESENISGDIFISVDTVLYNAKKYEISFDEEMKRVIIHGILHLIGFKDKSEEESQLMREKENFYLNKYDSTD